MRLWGSQAPEERLEVAETTSKSSKNKTGDLVLKKRASVFAERQKAGGRHAKGDLVAIVFDQFVGKDVFSSLAKR